MVAVVPWCTEDCRVAVALLHINCISCRVKSQVGRRVRTLNRDHQPSQPVWLDNNNKK